jgi:PAS domain S-box-containing protein
MNRTYRGLALRIALLYVALALVWILLSDYLLVQLVPDIASGWLWATLKGWLFVFVSATFWYHSLQRVLAERFRLNRELETHARQQEALALLRQRALSATTEASLLNEAITLIAITLEVDTCAVLEYQPAQQQVLLRAGVGWREGLVGQACVAAPEHLDWIQAGSGLQPQAAVDLLRQPLFAEHAICSGISSAIVGRTHPFGLVGAYSSEPRTFSSDEERFVQSVATVLAHAIGRARAEEELRMQKTLLECQSEASPDGVMIISSDNQILSYNQRIVEMWQIDPALMATRNRPAVLSSVLHRLVDAEKFVREVDQLNADRSTRERTEVPLRDGSVFERYTAPVEDADGTYYGRVWYYRDITAMRQAQEALRRSEQMFRTLVQSMDDIVYTLDHAQRHTGVYGRWLARYNLPAAAFLGKTSREINPDTAHIHEAANQRALAGEYVVYEWSTATPDGPLAVQTSLSPIHDEQGSVIGLVGVGRDITAIKQAEAAVRQSEANFRTLAETIPATTLIFRDGQVLYVNTAAETLTGYTRDELLQQHPGDILTAESHDMTRDQAIRLVSSAPQMLSYEARIVRRDGAPRWLAVTANQIDHEGQAAGLVTAFDITERKQAEDELRQRNHQLAALNMVTEAVSMFLDVPELLSTLRVLLAEHLHITAGIIFLYHEADDQLVLELAWGLPHPMREQLSGLHVATAYNTSVVRDKATLRRCDLQTNPLCLTAQGTMTDPDWHCYMGVPLVAHGGVQGVLDLFSAQAGILREDQEGFFAGVGQQVGIAIQNARLFQQVYEGRERLQVLSRRLVEVQEAERRHIARELHDEIGQILTGLNLSLELATRLPPEQRDERLDYARGMVETLMSQVREMSLELRPPMLDDLGLLPALLWYAERYTDQTGVRVLLKHTGIERRFAPEIEIAVYRIVQEALTNVARHAGVGEVTVRLWVSHDVLGLQIEDQGAGFVPEAALSSATSSGLSGMHERTLLLGGDLQIESEPGKGSRLAVEFPLHERMVSVIDGDNADDNHFSRG